MVFQWRIGVAGMSKDFCRLDCFLTGGKVKAYGLLLYDKNLITYYLYFLSIMAYFRSSDFWSI